MYNRNLTTGALLSVAIVFLAPNAQAQHTATKSDPNINLWLTLKKELTGPNALEYFEKNLKDSRLPTLAGRLVSASPANQPHSLTLSMPGADDAEVTIRLKGENNEDTHLNGPLANGSVITFQGTVISFTSQPFMLIMDASTSPATPPPGGWGAVQHPKQSPPSK